MKLTIPELSLVVLVGASGSGKSTFARKHFRPTEILSSDFCRALVSDDENSQEATRDAFEILHFITAKRLAAARLTVIDATNVQPEARKPLVAIARQYHTLPVAIVLDMPEKLCHERNRQRADRNFGPHVVRQHRQQLRRSLSRLRDEGFRQVWVLSSPEEIEAVEIDRQPLWADRKHEHGPFDIIGDVHGCFDELVALLAQLGYEIARDDETGRYTAHHAENRKAVFLGDLVDRGPRIADTLKLVIDSVEEGAAICVPGNHDMKLLRKLKGRDVKITHGLAESLAQLEGESKEFIKRVTAFLDSLISHFVLDDGRLVVAHAGMKEEFQGRASRRVRDFALYGETTGETDEYGLPVRYNWAAEYRGRAMVVYGHTPVIEPEFLNRTINVDTGCVFGGRLTALRYPEQEIVSVPAARVYYESVKPFLTAQEQPPSLTAQQEMDDLLDIEDALGKRIIDTRLRRGITIREENAITALEVMSRFAASPKWLVYLPPTMSPSETSTEPEYLEHPAEAFGYYLKEGVTRVVCEEKHMGSRAVLIVCRDEDAARRRFGVINEGAGICYTRTGRRFFDDGAVETALLDRMRKALDVTNFWEEFETDWVCIDAELMPWSAKAQELLRKQYAAVGAASLSALDEAITALAETARRDEQIAPLLERFRSRREMAALYREAYRRYCWTVASIDDLRLAPFHLLATEGAVHADKDHVWHMETIARICRAGEPVLMVTPYKVIDITDPSSCDEGQRVVDGTDRQRRRRHGRKTDGLHREGESRDHTTRRQMSR